MRHEGWYIGETSRTLSGRALEHREALDRLDPMSFMLKHWSSKYHDLNVPPDFVFIVVKKHNDELGRLVHDAVKILDCVTLNSKYGGIGYKIPGMTVEKTYKDTREQLDR